MSTPRSTHRSRSCKRCVDVPAGEQITADMLRTVDVDVDSSVNVIAGDRLDSLVGQLREGADRVRFAGHRRGAPAVTPGRPPERRSSPSRSRTVRCRSACASGSRSCWSFRAMARTPIRASSRSRAEWSDCRSTSSALGRQSLSVEVAAADAATMAAADDVRVVLVEPTRTRRLPRSPRTARTASRDHRRDRR